MLLTDAQLHEIRQIIADYHNAFVVNTISPDAVDEMVLQRLKDLGLVNVEMNVIEDSYLYGRVIEAMEDPKVAKMSYQEFRDYVKRNPVPLSAVEKRAISVAQHTAAQYAVGLGRRVDMETGATLLGEDQALANQMRDTIRTTTAESIARRESAAQLKSKLGWATRDWARDWDRIAITEMHNAHQRGQADSYVTKFGSGVRVAKRVMPDACPHCVRLYVGPDGHPRIFKLSELEKNGTNFKKKVADWKPVLGAVHPHCQCQLIRIPEGWGFAEDGALVPGGEFGVEYGSEEDMELAFKAEMDLVKSAAEGHVRFQGLPITIENAPGTIRRWTDDAGNQGSTLMLFAYGYLDHTDAMDGDELDVYVGPDPLAQNAYIVHQQNPKTGIYDEDKVMLGFSHEQHAVQAYRFHFDKPDDYLLTVTPMRMEQFKRWAASSAEQGSTLMKGKPVVRYVIPMDMEKAELATVSGHIATEAIASRAGDRAPGPQLGVNYVFPVPQRDEAPAKMEDQCLHMTPREMFEEFHHRTTAVKRDKRDYEYREPLGDIAKPIEIPDNYKDFITLDSEAAEERKEHLIKEGLKNTARPQNKVDVE
jgi:hypothetical protein